MTDESGWEYRVAVFKNPDVYKLEAWLNDFGVAGWEVVTLSTTVKTWINLTGRSRCCDEASNAKADGSRARNTDLSSRTPPGLLSRSAKTSRVPLVGWPRVDRAGARWARGGRGPRLAVPLYAC